MKKIALASAQSQIGTENATLGIVLALVIFLALQGGINMETKAALQKKLALLETTNDQLLSELSYIDHLMRLVGFTSGIAGLKETAHDFCKQEKESPFKESSFDEI